MTLGVDSGNPHFLFAGQTGSGKTWAMRSALVPSLAQDSENRLILIDAKWGDGLGDAGGLAGPELGPVATDLETAKAALGWAAHEMRKRYEAGGHSGRIIVAIDEVQELQGDPAAVEALAAPGGAGARRWRPLPAQGTQYQRRAGTLPSAIPCGTPGRLEGCRNGCHRCGGGRNGYRWRRTATWPPASAAAADCLHTHGDP